MAEQSIQDLTLIGDEIQNVVRNYKKDSSARKGNVQYFQTRINRLDVLWRDFQANDEELRAMENVPLDHNYFKAGYYNQIKDLVQQYKKLFQNEIIKLEQPVAQGADVSTKPLSAQGAIKRTLTPEGHGHPADASSQSSPNGIIRRFKARFAAVERLIAGTATNVLDQPPQYARVKGEAIQSAWRHVEELYEAIWEQYEDPAAVGVDLDNYVQLEELVQNQLMQLSIDAAPASITTNVAATTIDIPLPKVTIPRFDGNYLKWSQFFDLFSHMVDKQQLPNVQKMYYLKSNVTGEAERLISHLAVTDENYNSAWTLLQERYNNKRVLAASLVQKLLNQPAETGSAGSIKALHDKTQECLLALNNIGIPTDSWDPLLLQLLVKKLDRETHMRYEQSISRPKELQTIPDFLSFLEVHFQSLEAFGMKGKVHSPTAKSYTSVVTHNNKTNACRACGVGTHQLFSCKQFLDMNPSERLKLVQREKLCVNCMKTGHMAAQCSSRNCMKCDRKHNTLLHLPSKSSSDSVVTPAINTTSSNAACTGPPAAVLTTSTLKRKYVLLGTVILNIATGRGDFIKCRGLLDSGSQINFITERFAKKLGLQFNVNLMSVEGIGLQKNGCKRYVHTSIKSLTTPFKTNIEAFILPKLVSNQPARKIDISTWNIPPNIQLSDPDFNVPGEIDLLIGAELYHDLLIEGQLKIAQDLPTLQNTVFGWMFCGKIGDVAHDTMTCGICYEDDDSLNSLLTRFWELDEVQTTTPSLTEAETKCENTFKQTTTRISNGRFVVRLPFKTDTSCLGETLQMATNRFYSLEQRLLKQPKLKEMYVEFMREYEQLGHMKRVRKSDLRKPYYIIPHHCVLKPDSTTTKLRVVFDASAKSSTGLSLNDIMHKGPVVQSELTSILLRFRKHRFVFTTDVEKMYRQILIHQDDQQFQTILWRENPSDELQLFQLTTVTYGTRTAPYLSTKCLQQLAHNNKNILPLGAVALENDFYVDDGISGSDSLLEANAIKTQLVQILSAAGFKLRKWCANSAQLLEGIPIQDQEVDLNFEDEASRGSIKTLGLIWLPKTDELCIKSNQDFNKLITKKTVTSELARIYDPLGIVSPVIVKAKIFIQRLWQMKIGWDDEIPEKMQEEWSTFRQELHMLNNVRIPRHVFNHKQVKTIQLHVFTDASERAYGAAVYIRSENKDGTITVHLLCSKSRVAPLKTQTIPRLELCAALLGAELATRVKNDLNYHDVIMHCWTDSEVVLSWIYSEPASFQTFVSHRVTKLQELTMSNQWRHVGTKDNPADVVSRGMNPGNIKQCTIWWYGPLFLHGKESCWPAKFNKITTNFENLERKVCNTGVTSAINDDIVQMTYTINHSGRFVKLQRIVAYMMRFISNTRNHEKVVQPLLSTKELNNALVIICRGVQLSEFADEIKLLSTGRELKLNNPIAGLSPFLDAEGLIRVGGRLQESQLPFDARHPILLPYNDPIVKLLMRYLHETNFHCGPQALLAQVRQKYWPIKGKVMARSIVQHCVRCTHSQPKLFKQIMGNLPHDRVQLERPFLNVGVDFCGPIWIHYKIRGKRPCKAYIAVFCCFATKAVHLELVGDLTTDAFIGALNRFISRRGCCQVIHCDNATNFVGAKNKLMELEDCVYSNKAKETIHNISSQKGIDFQFIPPRAPHFGGLWEAAVKSAKHLLVRGIGNASLIYEELETVIVQIEGILNSRPITPMSSNPNDLTALTPGHFLIGEPITTYPSPSVNDAKISLLHRWKLVYQLREEFWSRWSKEYLNELQCRSKWKTQTVNVEPGTMVIVKEDNLPPLQWHLGRVTKTFNGPDDCVRVAEIKTKTGTIKRAIHRLAPLFPVEKGENSTQTLIKSVNEETPPKRQKLTANTTFLTLIALIFCLPLVLGNAIEITKLPNKPGIHFENMGKGHIITTHWTLLTYYDLDPLKTELAALTKGTALLQRMCQQLQNEACSDLAIQFTLVKDELESDGRLLLQRRTKRGAINVVGNVANALFGVLDSEYATAMSKTIQKIDNNEHHLFELMKNQTSIIDSTINIVKTDQQAVKRKFDALDNSLNNIQKNVQTAVVNQTLFQTMLTVALNLMITTSNLHRIQAVILNVLTDVHHGQIGPLLLSPEQLKNEITKIKGHLPTSVRLPAQQEDLLSLYKVMTVEAGLTHDHVLFKITLPLIGTHEFNMYKVIPIAAAINGSLQALKPTTEFLAITPHGDMYYPLSQQQYMDCLKVNLQLLCSHTQSIYNRGSKENSCEVKLFNNETKLSCDIMKVPNDQWIQLNNKNQWIFSLKQPMKVTAVCAENVHQVLLSEAGILKMKPECTIKNELFTLIGHQTLNSVIAPSITTHGQWSYLENAKITEPLLLENAVEPYKIEVNELVALQKLLHEQQFNEFPSFSQKMHVFSIGYTALLLVIVLGLYLIAAKFRRQRRRGGQIPTPAPRHPDFAIHV